MKTPKYKLTNLILNYIVKYELCMSEVKHTPIPEKYKQDIIEKFGTEDILNLSGLISYPIGYNKALLIQRGQEMPSEKKTYRIFTNFRNARDYVKSYQNNNIQPSMDLVIHINKLITQGIVDDWDSGKIRSFSEKPNEIYDTWYKKRDFYPNLEPVAYFNEILDWIGNPKDGNHKLIKIAVMMYELIDKAPFMAGNQITTILLTEMLTRIYGYNPDDTLPIFKAVNIISEDILSAFKISKSSQDMTTFIEAYLYTLSLSILEVGKEYENTYKVKVKQQGTLELNLTHRQIKVLDYLTLNQKISRHDVTKMMGVSFMTSYRDLKDMIQKGYIKQKGKGRGTYYVLSKEMLENEEDILINEID